MTKQNYTHLSLIVDRSGSMMGMAKDAEGGINTLIKEQAKVEGEITVSLYQFDNQYEKVFGPVSASDAPEYRLVPRGSTALLDSTNRAIAETGEYLSAKPESERPSKVIFVIVTDGYENASREVTRDQLKTKITEQENKYDWEFIYLGANLDAVAESVSLGLRAKGVQYTNTGASMRSAYAGVSSSVTNSRLSGATVASTMAKGYDAEGNEVKE